jgi:ATP-binding cassette subfamily B protein
VLYMIKKRSYFILDPGFGLIEYNQKDFIKLWIGNNAKETTEEGYYLIIRRYATILAILI